MGEVSFIMILKVGGCCRAGGLLSLSVLRFFWMCLEVGGVVTRGFGIGWCRGWGGTYILQYRVDGLEAREETTSCFTRARHFVWDAGDVPLSTDDGVVGREEGEFDGLARGM